MIASLRRISVIAGHTFTLLVRMKVFGFLAVFAIILIAAHFFKLPQTYGPESVAEEELCMMKSSAMGAMSLFAVIFSIAATGLLIPRDVEDRTLYTILCKPVPRFDYLAGKYLGVLFTVFIALLIMDLLMSVALYLRTMSVLEERMNTAAALGWSEEVKETERQEVLRQGVTWSVHAGVLAIFLKAMVSAGVALLISTFSTSTLFTIIMGFLVYFIGHYAGDAREYWLSKQLDESPFTRFGSHLMSVVFPDFRLFNIIDGAIAGIPITASMIWKLTAISMIYAAVYLILSWFAFAKKEF